MAAQNVELQFKCSNTEFDTCDPEITPITIVGQLDHLKRLPYDRISRKFNNLISNKLYTKAIESLCPLPIACVPLYLHQAKILAISSRPVTFDNSPTRANSLLEIMTKSYVKHGTAALEYIVVVCPRAYVLPYVAALSRVFPLYNSKTTNGGMNLGKIKVEVFLVDGPGGAGGDKSCKKTLKPLNQEELRCLQEVSKGVRNAAKVVDIPCTIMNVQGFIEEADGVFQELKALVHECITKTEIRGRDLETLGFGGLWNVGKGAEHLPSEGLPALVVLSYRPKTQKKGIKNIAWVGKGIVFDSGGLSIKPRNNMVGMKRDCGGAAAILHAFSIAVKQGFTENLHAVLCLAENSVSGNAMRVDDVIRLYSGKTVEVNNTDAEGRLVLGDGVAYAKKDLKCTIILTMATLTGAQGTATGKYHGAVLTNNEAYLPLLRAAGKTSGDLTHPLPFSPELHFSEFNSTVADMKNSDRTGGAAASNAGLFIFSHIGFDFPGTWLHVDMASPCFIGERATGFGVMLLCTLFGKHLDQNSLFQEIAPPLVED